MASGAILLQWHDRNWAEHGHYIYRSNAPMDTNALPNPIASVEKNVTEYIDYDVIEGNTYYYRIAAYRNNDIVVSDEIALEATPGTLDVTDVFNDNSILAYYRLDQTPYDETGNFTATEYNSPSYTNSGVYGYALSSGYLMSDLVIPDTFTVSIHVKLTSTPTDLVSALEFHSESNTKHIIGYTPGRYAGPVYGADPTSTNKGAIDYMFRANLGQWYHIVYDSSGRFYVDNAPTSKIGSEAFYGGAMAQPFTLRYRSRGRTPEFPGEIDQVRVFNRLLTEQEIDILNNEY